MKAEQPDMKMNLLEILEIKYSHKIKKYNRWAK